MSEKTTYLVTQTRAENPDLWLVQTDDESSLIRNLLVDCGGAKRGVIFKLSLASVQKNNCFGGQLLTQVCDCNPADAFYLYIQEAISRVIWHTPKAERPALISAAIQRLQLSLDLETKRPVPLEGENQTK